MSSFPVVPAYLLIEASAATWTGLGHVQQAWSRTVSEVRSQLLPATPNLGVMSYSMGLEQNLAISVLDGSVECPPITAGSGVSLGADDFHYLREVITHDLDWFKSNGSQVVRPVVFVIAATNPTPPAWEGGIAWLLDSAFNYRPNLVAFAASPDASAFATKISTTQRFVADNGVDVNTAMANAIDACFDMVVGAAQNGKLSFPPNVPGFR